MASKMPKNLKKWIVSALAAVVVVGGGWYFFGPKALGPTQYVLTPVSRDTVIVTVNGTGQVSGVNQIDVKPQVSGVVTDLFVQPGQAVKANDPLFHLDDTTQRQAVRDAQQSVQNARISLQSSQLSLAKLQKPPDAVVLAQDQDAVNQAQRALTKLTEGADANDVANAKADLATEMQSVAISSDGMNPQVVRDAYDNAVGLLQSVAQTLQQSVYDGDAIIGVDNISANLAYNQYLSLLDTTKIQSAKTHYYAAKLAVQNLKKDTDALKATDEDAVTIDRTLSDARDAVNAVGPYLQLVYQTLQNTPTSSNFSATSLGSLESTIQSDISSVSSKQTSVVGQIQAIAQSKTSYQSALLNVQKAQSSLEKLQEPADPKDIATAQEKVLEAQKTLAKLQQGTDTLDIQTAQNQIAQQNLSLSQAQSKLADALTILAEYTVRAPFDGIIADIQAQKAAQASSGAALATILTTQQISKISLNEVDAAKVKTGQRVTLTFDAIPGLTIAGVVSAIDPLGTVTQGVVNYSVTIAFSTQDSRIKPGMSATANIVTNVSLDALVVPNAAIKTLGGSSYVQVLTAPKAASSTTGLKVYTSDTAPQSRPVQVGLASDQETEIVSGLNEGDLVISQTIVPTTAKPATAAGGATSALRATGLGGGAGGFAGGGGGFAGGGTGRGGAAAGR